MSCSDSYPRPGKLYAEVDLVNSVDGNCGINCSTTSCLELEISNLGGSPVDVFVEAQSVHLETVFVNSQNRHDCCYGLPISGGRTETVNVDIQQDNPRPNNAGSDKLVLEIAFRDQPAKLNHKDEFGSIPSDSVTSGKLESEVHLRDP